MSTQKEILQAFFNSLDKTNLVGEAAVDEAIKACSRFESFKNAIDGFLADRNNSASGDDFLRRYCGIILDNADTGAITAYDAGGSEIKTKESVVPKSDIANSVYPPSNSFSYKGLTINVPDASELNDVQKNIVAGIYTWWLKGGLDLIYETYGISFEDSDVSFNSIDVGFDMEGYSDSSAIYEGNFYNEKSTSFSININADRYKDIINSDSNGKSSLEYVSSLDRLLTSMFSQAIASAKIDYEWELPSIISKGICRIVDGIDDIYSREIKELVVDKQKLFDFLKFNKRDHSDIRFTNSHDTAMGYMFLRYLARRTVDVDNVMSGTAGNDSLENYFFDITINGGAGNDSIKNCSSYVTIIGGTGNDTIHNEGDNVLFKYSSGDGNDLIEGFNSSSTLQIGSGTVKSVMTSGSSLILGIGDGAVTLNNVADIGTSNLNIVDSNKKKINFNVIGTEKADNIDSKFSDIEIRGLGGNDTINNTGNKVTITSGDGNDTVSNNGSNVIITGEAGSDSIDNRGATVTIDAGVGNDTIFNSGNAVSINASSGNDSIYNDWRGSNVTIIGGAGNDTIYNNWGDNVLFKYSSGDGNDLIEGFNSSSSLQIGSGTVKSVSASNEDIILFIGNGSITLRNPETVNIVDAKGKAIKFDIEINGTNGDDNIFNKISNTVIRSGKGGDSISSNSNNVTVYGGEDNNHVYVNGKENRVFAGNGNNNISFNGEGNIASIGNGNNNINCTGSDNTIMAGTSDPKGKGGNNISATSNSNNGNHFITGNGPDNVNNNGTNTSINTNGGSDYVYTCSNASRNNVNLGDGSDTVNANGSYSTLNGGNGPDVMYNKGKGSHFNGDADRDTMYNGNSDSAGSEIAGQRQKAQENVEKMLEDINRELFQQYEENPMLKDIYEKGEDSAYFLGLTDNEKKAIIKLLGNIKDGLKWDVNIINEINNIESMYDINKEYLINKIYDLARHSDPVINKNYPTIAKMERSEAMAFENALNKNEVSHANFSKNMGRYIKLAKRIKGVGSAISAFELCWAIDKTIKDPNAANFDSIITSGIDLVTSFIPIPFVDILVAESSKAVYKSGAEFTRKQFAKSNSSSSGLLAFYNNDTDESLSFDMLEEYYLETNSKAAELDPDTVIMNGGADNDAMLNNMFNLVLMNGDDGDDNIKNYNSSNVTINGGNGRDLITNLNSSNVQIDGGAEQDTIISNYSSDVTIYSGAGNDYVTVYDNSNVKISTGEGDDTVENFGKYALIQTGNGADSIFNIGANVSIDSGNANDEIESCGDEVTINAGAGDNYINLEGENILLTAGNGANLIYTEEFYYSTIQTGNGEDEIFNLGSNNTINAGNGDNAITNIGDHNSILTGSGEDYIENVGDSNIINAGAGNDLMLIIDSSSNTINSGNGDDLIYLDGGKNNIIQYSAGNDTIYGYDDISNVIKITNGKINNTLISGEDLFIKVGDGSLTLTEVIGKKIQIQLSNSSTETINIKEGSSSTNTVTSSVISNTKASVSVVGTSAADKIKNTGSKASVYGYAGNDSIYNSASSVKVYAGDGNDTINSSGSALYLDGGAGADKITISGTGTNNTIYGGAGNDTIYSTNTKGVMYSYAKGDGNDVINGWTAKDTLSITGGSYKLSTVGNNVKVSITGNAINLSDTVIKANWINVTAISLKESVVS